MASSANDCPTRGFTTTLTRNQLAQLKHETSLRRFLDNACFASPVCGGI
jgi:hypothetical protein